MLTISDSSFSAHEGAGTCPTCLGKVRFYAILNGLMHWQLVERCQCKHINNVVDWPFREEPTFDAVKPSEFYQHGVFLNVGESTIDDDALQQWMEDMYADEEEAYMHDVDHGWEESWY